MTRSFSRITETSGDMSTSGSVTGTGVSAGGGSVGCHCTVGFSEIMSNAKTEATSGSVCKSGT